jgi:hypothetical protein
MPTGSETLRKYDRWLRQRRGAGLGEPTSDARTAFLRGDLQARASLADRAADRELTEKRMALLDKQFQQTHGLARERQENLEDYARWSGLAGLTKLGIEAAPSLYKGGKWLYGKMTQPQIDLDPMFDAPDYKIGDYGARQGTIFDQPDMFDPYGYSPVFDSSRYFNPSFDFDWSYIFGE